MCLAPYRQGVAEYGCGQCMPCKFNRRRLWTSRMVLESRLHDFSWFVTLTFDDVHVPVDGSVAVRELQLFLKRLRAIVRERFRYYGVGEYGDDTWRPHYHLVLFGLSDPLHVNPDDAAMHGMRACDCVVCTAWGKGGVDVQLFCVELAAYLAKYVVKRLTGKDDDRLCGRHPEFARMSLRPGIGAGAMPVLGKTLSTRAGALSVARAGDVPSVVRFEGAQWPLGRYLRGKLREECGFVDGKEPCGSAFSRGREMQNLLLEDGAVERREQKRIQVGRRSESLNRISNSRKVGRL